MADEDLKVDQDRFHAALPATEDRPTQGRAAEFEALMARVTKLLRGDE